MATIRKILAALGCAMALALAVAAPAHAEKRVALVIGNSSYVHIPRLANPANDARLMAQTLRALGFTLVGAAAQFDLDESGLRRAVQNFGSQLAGADVALFYYAGHGVQVSGRNYLVPVGANPVKEADVDFQMLDANLVLRQMESAGAKLNLVIFDACRNNPFGGRGLRTAAPGLATMQAPEGTLISFATQPGNVALDGAGGNSPYTKALAEVIRKPGLDIFRAFNEVGLVVAGATGGQQQPWVSLSPIKGEFYFAGRAIGVEPRKDASADAAVTALQQRLKALEEQLKKKDAKKDEPKVAVGTFPPKSEPAPSRTYKPGETFKECDDCPEMVVVPAGSFTMGSPASERGRSSSEGPQHRVTIAKHFAVGKFEVTFAEWDACVADGGCNGYKPADQGWGRGRRPVINVSWTDALSYISWLQRRTGRKYHLLSEAQWEYAARAGTTTPFSTGRTITTGQANFDGNYSSPKGQYRQSTVAVGALGANAFGLHEMHGNTSEWTEDCWNGSFAGAPSDGSAWTSGECGRRVLRGGCWSGVPSELRSAHRGWNDPGVRAGCFGFRVARTLTP
jgi:formylglycine-generating enzyme required for sulfatase activity